MSPTCQPGGVRTDLFDDPGALVSAGRGEGAGEGQVARRHMVVGVAQARGDHPHHELVLARRLEIDLGDLPLARLLEEDGGSGLHALELPTLRCAPGSGLRAGTSTSRRP